MSKKSPKLNHILVYANYEQGFRSLTDAAFGRIIRGMLHYINTGEEYVPKGAEVYAWDYVKDQLDRNIEKYQKVCERNRNNSQKYWDSRKKLNENASGTQPE